MFAVSDIHLDLIGLWQLNLQNVSRCCHYYKKDWKVRKLSKKLEEYEVKALDVWCYVAGDKKLKMPAKRFWILSSRLMFWLIVQNLAR